MNIIGNLVAEKDSIRKYKDGSFGITCSAPMDRMFYDPATLRINPVLDSFVVTFYENGIFSHTAVCNIVEIMDYQVEEDANAVSISNITIRLRNPVGDNVDSYLNADAVVRNVSRYGTAMCIEYVYPEQTEGDVHLNIVDANPKAYSRGVMYRALPTTYNMKAPAYPIQVSLDPDTAPIYINGPTSTLVLYSSVVPVIETDRLAALYMAEHKFNRSYGLETNYHDRSRL